MTNLTFLTRTNLTRTNTRRAARQAVTASAALAACFAITACGAVTERLTEEGAERIIEAQGGGDVELDFNDEDGSFSIETEDGSFAVDEDGNFVVTDQDGSVFTGSANDDSFVVNDGSGEEVVSIDNDSGEISIEGENGDEVFRVVEEIPAEWPADVPRPDGLEIESGTFIGSGTSALITVIGERPDGAVDYVESYVASLESAGFTETGQFSSSADGEAAVNYTLERGPWTMFVTGIDGQGSDTVSISLSNSE